MSDSMRQARGWIVAAIRDNPANPLTDPALLARLNDPAADCSFEELGIDSLGAMELCIYIECETRVSLTTADLETHSSVNLLARHLSKRLGRRRWLRV